LKKVVWTPMKRILFQVEAYKMSHWADCKDRVIYWITISYWSRENDGGNSEYAEADEYNQ